MEYNGQILASLVKAKNWKELKYLPIDEWIYKLRYICTSYFQSEKEWTIDNQHEEDEFKIIIWSEGRLTKKRIIWCTLYDSIYGKFYTMQTSMSWDQGLPKVGEEKWERDITKWQEETSGDDDVHYNDCFMVSQSVYSFVKIYQITYFKYCMSIVP